MESYVGEIRMFAGNFAPEGWALCNGQLLSIAENDMLFALLGTTYGGDGQTTFGLPDLQGRAPLHVSPTYPLGAKGGTETVTLTANQMPMHTHVPNATTGTAESTNPANCVWAKGTYESYAAVAPDAAMSPSSVAAAGGSQPHENMMPSLAISYIISLYGVFPSSN
ncbi:MAG TPA: tail fiber protein [Telluria sp.]|nr:tail fiber protein [Telluria sp.]